jgi:hypothetical protein
MATKKKSIEDRLFPMITIPKLSQPTKPPENQQAIKKIVQWAIQGAFRVKTPSDYDLKYGNIPKIEGDKIQLITYLIESLQPSDAIEAALAAQFAITHIRGMHESSDGCVSTTLEFFEFSHKALETLQKYRSKGAQQISVQYNVNQGQVVNIKNVKEKEQPVTLDGATL